MKTINNLKRANIYTLLVFIVAFCYSTTAQSWQWAKRGGANDDSEQSILETATKLATDSQGNIYVVSLVGKGGLNIDGVPKINHGQNSGQENAVVASFDCQGNYRWSKVMGNEYPVFIRGLVIDSQDNVYIIADFGISSSTRYYDTDATQYVTNSPNSGPNGYTLYNLHNIDIIKYSNTGSLLWIKHLDNDITYSNDINSTTYKNVGAPVHISIDSAGNLNVICYLTVGTFLNGLYTNTHTVGFTLHSLKFDANGAFISGHYIDFTSPGGDYLNETTFCVSPTTGNLYMAIGLFIGQGSDVYVAGTLLDRGLNLVKFDAQGNYVWKVQSNPTSMFPIRCHAAIDSDENIYFTSYGVPVNNVDSFPPDTFAGFSFYLTPQAVAEGIWYIGDFIVKINSNGQGVWSNFQSFGGDDNQRAGVNGNEAAIGIPLVRNTWRGVASQAAGVNTGYPGIVRFDKETGDGIAIAKITASNNSSNYVSSITADSKHNYIIGGRFTNSLTTNSGTITSNGGSYDFFVAKYGTNNCNCEVPTCLFKTTNTSQNNTINFKYYGQNVYTSVAWNFGDSSPVSNVVNPTHQYATPGVYNVCLTATNSCDSFTFCNTVDTTQLGNEDFILKEEAQLVIAPNPASSTTNILFKNNAPKTILELYDLTGRLIKNYETNLPKAIWTVDVSHLSAGIYIVVMKSENKIIAQQKLIIDNG